jgi:hypothetical protein
MMRFICDDAKHAHGTSMAVNAETIRVTVRSYRTTSATAAAFIRRAFVASSNVCRQRGDSPASGG